MNIVYYIIRLTVVLEQCFTIALLCYTMKTRLTCLYTNNYVSPKNSPKRITLVKRIWGVKIRAPPINKRVNANLIGI